MEDKVRGKVPDFALLIGKPKGKMDDEEPGEEGKEMDSGEGEDSAVRDFISAVSARDVKSAKSALKDFLEICYPVLSDGKEEEPEEDEDYGR